MSGVHFIFKLPSFSLWRTPKLPHTEQDYWEIEKSVTTIFHRSHGLQNAGKI